MEKIAPWNKIHAEISTRNLGPQSKVFDHEDFFRDRSYLWKIYNRFSPSPLGALALSDELPLLHYLIQVSEQNLAYLDLAFLYRRLGNFDLAIHYAKKSIGYESCTDNTDAKLELAISLFLAKKNHEAKRVIARLTECKTDRQTSALQYWYHRINHFNHKFSLNDLLELSESNPLLVVDYVRCRANEKINFLRELHARLDQRPGLFEQECLIFFLIEEGFFNDIDLIRPDSINLLEMFAEKHKREISLRSLTLKQLALTFGNKKTLELLAVNGKVPLTSELMDQIFSRYPIFKPFLSSTNVELHRVLDIKKEREEDILYSEEICNIMYEDYILRDANTSSYQSRFYSLNLRIHESFNQFIKKELGHILDKSFGRMRGMLLDLNVDIQNDYELWFDASYTYGGSKINNHLHTASYDRSFLYTVVFYLCVPQAPPDEGRIVIHAQDKDISTLPETGTVASFPPWFWHETTPINAGDLRITVNIDILSKEQVFIPLALFDD
jgi:hypothetical protein